MAGPAPLWLYTPIRKLKDKQNKMRIVFSDRAVDIQVVYNYTLTVIQESTSFLQDLFPTQKCWSPLTG